MIHADEIVDKQRWYVGYRLCKECDELVPDELQADVFHEAFGENVDGLTVEP